eukprot:365159-Chlamydomonas_euryale.AAC.31
MTRYCGAHERAMAGDRSPQVQALASYSESQHSHEHAEDAVTETELGVSWFKSRGLWLKGGHVVHLRYMHLRCEPTGDRGKWHRSLDPKPNRTGRVNPNLSWRKPELMILGARPPNIGIRQRSGTKIFTCLTERGVAAKRHSGHSVVAMHKRPAAVAAEQQQRQKKKSI